MFPVWSVITTAMSEARRLYDIIDDKPSVDVTRADGARLEPSTVRGAISFSNVSFKYPSRPDEVRLSIWKACGPAC